MKDLFNLIQELCESILFVPFHELRELELTNWWVANLVTWAFIGVGIVAFIYWMLQLKSFSDNNEEDKSISSHSYL
ncbi:MAG: uracil phosphoribosyltransferase [Flavobacteriaceae bacterium]|nr:uracil phosphoribosyltransferase [Flavobacteriaceae bacterium]